MNVAQLPKILNTVTLKDDKKFYFGTDNPFAGAWDTEDPNANMRKVELPSGGAVDIPAVLFGIGILGVDLGIWDGITFPRIGLIDNDQDSWVAFGFNADDDAQVFIGGSAALTLPAFTAGGDIAMNDNKLMLSGSTYYIAKRAAALILDVYVNNQRVILFSSTYGIECDKFIKANAGIKMADEQAIQTGEADNDYLTIKADDTGVGVVEVARAQGAADPYFSMGGSQQFKFYYSGIAEMNGDYDFYPATDNEGELGLDANRWKRIRAVTIVSGDFVFENGWSLTETKQGIALLRPTGEIAQEWN